MVYIIPSSMFIVNDTLIGGSTPTTSNTLETNEVNNKSGEAEPVGGIK